MSGFANTKYGDTVEALLTTAKNKILSNPNYKFTDKPPTPVTYFNINKYKSTLDEAAKIEFANIDPSSGLVWNKINKLFIYGIEKIQISTSVEDFGLQTQDIEGECYILPNTITPYAGDFFLINHVSEKLIFEVIDVAIDTLENGANMYKLQYRSSSVPYDEKKISELTEDSYEFIVDNVGTNFKPILKSEVSKLAYSVSDYIYKLQEYYKNMFYSGRVQTFVFVDVNSDHFYDPYMMEFIINNKLMESTDGEFLYLCHQTKLENNFALKYGRTIFHAIETKDLNIDKYNGIGHGTAILDPNTTFSNRYEDYYCINYDKNTFELVQDIPCFKSEVIDAIRTGTLFKHRTDMMIFNIVIKYFHGTQIIQNDLDELVGLLDGQESITLFYAVPCIIYCLKAAFLEFLKEPTKTY